MLCTGLEVFRPAVDGQRVLQRAWTILGSAESTPEQVARAVVDYRDALRALLPGVENILEIWPPRLLGKNSPATTVAIFSPRLVPFGSRVRPPRASTGRDWACLRSTVLSQAATTLLWQDTEFLLRSWHFRRNLLPLRSRCAWQIPAESDRYASVTAPFPLPWILKPPWMRVTQPDLVSSMASAICYVQIGRDPA
jgi:hypothetical protein